MAGNNPNLDIVNVNVYIKIGVIPICSQGIERKEKSDIIKGHNSVTNLRKMTNNNPNLHLVNINGHTKFGQILSI